MSIPENFYDDYYQTRLRRRYVSYMLEEEEKKRKEAEEKAKYDYKIKNSRADEILPLIKLIAKFRDTNLNIQNINFKGKKYSIYNDESKNIIIKCLDDGREILVGLKEKYENTYDYQTYGYSEYGRPTGSCLAGYIIKIRYTATNKDAIQFISNNCLSRDSINDDFSEKKLIDYLENGDIEYIIKDKEEAKEPLNWNLEGKRIKKLPNGNIQYQYYSNIIISSDLKRIISVDGKKIDYDTRENLDLEEDRLKVVKFLEEAYLKAEIVQSIQKTLEDLTKHYKMLQENKEKFDSMLLLAKKLLSAPVNAKEIVDSFSREELEFITNILRARLLGYEEAYLDSKIKVKTI